ncbi:MAG TPA: ATP synthase F1 subunit delta [Gaiellaceae bacterium]|jgi:F-type H+-transporting ATPase subunit delta|nr:ATP synthase F1 subunit delta [Gaiellaceae bacterium]
MAVAQRIYANALFEAAQEKGRLEPVSDDLHVFVGAVEQVRELRAFLESPEVDSGEKIEALREILSDADELVRNFILLLVEKGRGHELDEIVREFDAQVAVEEGILDVELTTAVELSDDEAKKLLGQIEQVSGRRLRATRAVDPRLIGGFVLRAGSRRADASVSGRLEGLRRELKGVT